MGVKKPLRVVEGGASRAQSVLLAALAASEGCELLAVHDGARPLVTQDVINRVILVSGILACVWCLVKGRGLYGVALLVLMGMLMVSRKSNREKRLSRLYGGLHFHMPDGEIVPISFDQVRSEYTHGQQSKYAGRKVTLRFPWWHLDLDGHGDTGFGLLIHFDGNDEAMAEAKALRSGEFVSVTGEIVPAGKAYFYIGNVTELRRVSEKEEIR